MSSAKEKEGDDYLKKGEKALSPSLFQWKPDWDTAVPMFEKAAVAYKLARKPDRAKIAYEKASLGLEKTDSPFLAAKHQENAAAMSKEAGAPPSEQAMFFRKACALYGEAGRIETAAQCLARAAASMQEADPEAASALYLESIDMFEEEGREAQAHDTYRAYLGLLLRRGMHADAAAFLLRFGAACDKARASSSQCKAYLGAVVVWLFAQDAVEAQRTLDDLLDVPVFGSSDEGQAAEDLLAAYRAGDVAAVQGCIKGSHVFKNGLDTAVARLAVKLPTGDIAAMSAALGGGGEGGGGGGAGGVAGAMAGLALGKEGEEGAAAPAAGAAAVAAAEDEDDEEDLC